MYYTYMLRCADGTIYSGIAASLENRMKVHFCGGPGGAKYVMSRGALRLECFWTSPDKGSASKLEYRLKQLSRDRKEALISGEIELEDVFSEKLECQAYSRGNADGESLKEFRRNV